MTARPFTDRLAARQPAAAPPPARPRLRALFCALADELAAEGIADPLGARLELAAVWSDLARLAGEDLPAAVGRWLDEDVNAVSPHRYAPARAALPPA